LFGSRQLPTPPGFAFHSGMAQYVAEKLKSLSFRGTLRAEESLFLFPSFQTQRDSSVRSE
jgi:hypothetical protein